MTTTTETTKEKQTPAFYIFDSAPQGQRGKHVGAAFPHKKGKGYGFIINGKWFSAFPPKAKS